MPKKYKKTLKNETITQRTKRIKQNILGSDKYSNLSNSEPFRTLTWEEIDSIPSIEED